MHSFLRVTLDDLDNMSEGRSKVTRRNVCVRRGRAWERGYLVRVIPDYPELYQFQVNYEVAALLSIVVMILQLVETEAEQQ